MPNIDDSIRELPKSLQGIETILIYLREKEKDSLSIRNISENTGLSMRVAKNILLQLEKFYQVERVVEKNYILPKWRITKFGKRVIKEARGIENSIQYLSREDELVSNIIVPTNIENLKDKIKQYKELIVSKLKSIQVELSKMLGTILNSNDPIFEDLFSIIINRIKFLRVKFSNLPKDPLAVYQIRKKDEKQQKHSKEEVKNLLLEIFFYDSVILNELNRLNDFNKNLSQFLDKEEISKGYLTTKDLREEIRILSKLIYDRESLNIKFHVISSENLKAISKNKIRADILNNIIDLPISKEEQTEGIKELILKFISMLNKGEKQLKDYNIDIGENIPLYLFHQLVMDENPNINITIDKLEEIINSLAEEGYLPGIKIIQEDEDHYLKLVQFKVQDISKKELELIAKALEFQSFTLADMVGATGWSTKQLSDILHHLSEVGILKYSKNYLHGDRWYIVSENKI